MSTLASRDAVGKPITSCQRAILICRCTEGLTIEKTAHQLGVSSWAVKKDSTRAFKRLGVSGIGPACFILGVRGRSLVEKAQKKRVSNTKQ